MSSASTLFRNRLGFMALGLCLAGAALAYIYLGDQRYVSTDNAQVRSAKTDVAAPISGVVRRVAVEPLQAVQAGDALYELALDFDAPESENLELVAPMDGVVVHSERVQPGEILRAGETALSLVATDGFWVDAHVKETDLARVKTGQAATVVLDAYPDTVWTAKVEGVYPASVSEFATLPAQNTSGNWVKVVQRVGVRLKLEDRKDAPILRSGLNAEVTIDTGPTTER